MGNIKELRLEFQRNGHLHIDNIVIVSHEHNYNNTSDNFTKVFNSHPIQLGAGKEYWWGINTKYSSSLQFGDSFENESVVVNQDESKKDQTSVDRRRKAALSAPPNVSSFLFSHQPMRTKQKN